LSGRRDEEEDMKRKLVAAVLGASVALVALVSAQAQPAPVGVAAPAAKPARIEMNPAVLVENNNLGNCFACHAVVNRPDIVAGNIAPPFVAMKARFPDRAKLRAIIFDEQANNPDTIMPPFGRNKILSAEQIDAIADYILQY
jgi:sulfur-oxidizing protein SoxX